MARRGGWHREGRRKPFRYVDAKGQPIRDEARLERIESLVIPPAWRDVWIASNAASRLQATGIDAAGRRQYLYHPTFRARQEEVKYDNLVRFGELLPDFRARAAEHLEEGPYGRNWACAVAATLVNRGWFRVGSERYARTGRTYGITTLTKRHVSVRGNRIRFQFRGKHRVLVRTTVVDDELSQAIKALLSFEGGARLLRFERDDVPVNLTGPILNAYIAENLSPDFTAKDFRTWGGTLTAAVALAEHGPPATAAEDRRVVAAVMRRVGEELGNTPAVARASYVSPAVLEQWRDGRTIEKWRDKRRRVVSGRDTELLAEEAALLSLLRSWRIRRATTS